ncbi:mRNA interferase [Fructilactobacillus fructivorans]|uniref:type II toxin-antitoxin system PemK/MazF family toxin n=1 Tax=Fructilactobacillus fructivorans TaxID=1614 RepID=UPI00070B69E9|nr:type II toxin-antitoxin system PemK/MazF family toxin [Fructilactobacillus fructivorans]KRN40866.1 hypothetical protein IV51_GL001092 [Fructilactobacillus fructivorans]
MNCKQGEIYFVNLEPALGTETKKKRPRLVVSNNHYNRLMNTVIVIPISSSEKYLEEKKYVKSPLYFQVNNKKIHGTAMLQHVRTVDMEVRSETKLVAKLDDRDMRKITNNIKQFF